MQRLIFFFGTTSLVSSDVNQTVTVSHTSHVCMRYHIANGLEGMQTYFCILMSQLRNDVNLSPSCRVSAGWGGDVKLLELNACLEVDTLPNDMC